MFKIEDKTMIYRFIPVVGVCDVCYVCSKAMNPDIPKISNRGIPPLKTPLTPHPFKGAGGVQHPKIFIVFSDRVGLPDDASF